MTRSLFSGLSVVTATTFLAVQAMAGPHLLPRIHLPKINMVPKINMGKSVGALTYPVTKSVVNGGKMVLKTAATAETLGVMPGVGPPGVNNAAKKIIVRIGGH